MVGEVTAGCDGQCMLWPLLHVVRRQQNQGSNLKMCTTFSVPSPGAKGSTTSPHLHQLNPLGTKSSNRPYVGYLPVKSQQEGKSWQAGRSPKKAKLLRAPGQPEEEGVGSLEKRVETETGV